MSDSGQVEFGWFQATEFFSSSGELGRRFTLLNSGILGFSEVLVKRDGVWQWKLVVIEGDERSDRAKISAERARELAPDAGVLAAPSCLATYPDAFAQRERIGGHEPDRVAWIDEAVRTTLKEIESRAGSARSEMMWSSPGSWDYDVAIDTASWCRFAFRTVCSLVEERELIIDREKRRAATDYPD